MSGYQYFSASWHSAQVPNRHELDHRKTHMNDTHLGTGAANAPTPRTSADLFRAELERIGINTDEATDDALHRLYRAVLGGMVRSGAYDFERSLLALLGGAI